MKLNKENEARLSQILHRKLRMSRLLTSGIFSSLNSSLHEIRVIIREMEVHTQTNHYAYSYKGIGAYETSFTLLGHLQCQDDLFGLKELITSAEVFG
jgi:hypothetical protein